MRKGLAGIVLAGAVAAGCAAKAKPVTDLTTVISPLHWIGNIQGYNVEYSETFLNGANKDKCSATMILSQKDSRGQHLVRITMTDSQYFDGKIDSVSIDNGDSNWLVSGEFYLEDTREFTQKIMGEYQELFDRYKEDILISYKAPKPQ